MSLQDLLDQIDLIAKKFETRIQRDLKFWEEKRDQLYEIAKRMLEEMEKDEDSSQNGSEDA